VRHTFFIDEAPRFCPMFRRSPEPLFNSRRTGHPV